MVKHVNAAKLAASQKAKQAAARKAKQQKRGSGNFKHRSNVHNGGSRGQSGQKSK
jgi:hypothetical protein